MRSENGSKSLPTAKRQMGRWRHRHTKHISGRSEKHLPQYHDTTPISRCICIPDIVADVRNIAALCCPCHNWCYVQVEVRHVAVLLQAQHRADPLLFDKSVQVRRRLQA